MRGHVARRGKVWAYWVDLPPGLDGKRRQKTKSGFRTRKEAQSALAELLGQLQSGYREPSRLTVADWLVQWLDLVKPDLQPHTWGTYERHVRVHLTPAFGALRLQQLEPLQIEEWLKGKREQLAPSTLRLSRTVLSLALRRAEELELIPRNPVARTRPVKLADADCRGQSYSPEALGQVLQQATGWARVAILIGLGCGLRRGEVMGLRWGDVDLQVGTASVVQTVMPPVSAGKPFISKPKSKSSLRTVSLPLLVVEALQSWKAEHAALRLRAGKHWQAHDLLFPDAQGNPQNPNVLTRAWRKAREAAGVEGRFHDLRHTHTTHLADAGVPIKAISERLGHADVRVTLNIYSHVQQSQRDSAATAADAALRSVLEGA